VDPVSLKFPFACKYAYLRTFDSHVFLCTTCLHTDMQTSMRVAYIRACLIAKLLMSMVPDKIRSIRERGLYDRVKSPGGKHTLSANSKPLWKRL
jgi:hypothetical protein